MHLSLQKTRVQQDKVNPPDAEEGELVHWKRVKVNGVAESDRGRTTFHILLDLRPRLLQVISDDPRKHGADRIAETLINHMCRFTLTAREDLFHLQESAAERAEWIVHDGVHVSGLLHRLGEAQPLAEMKEPPLPPGLKEILKKLMQDVKENRNEMDFWNEFTLKQGKPTLGTYFSTASWDVFAPRLSELLHNRDILVDFAAFFEYAHAYSYATRKVLDMGLPWSKGATGDARSDNMWSFFSRHYSTVIQIADRLEAWYKTVEWGRR